MTATQNIQNTRADDTSAADILPLAVERLDELTKQRRDAILRRGRDRVGSLGSVVRPILDDVRERGDAALLEYAERFDGARPAALRVPSDEITRALAEATPAYQAALRQAAGAIETFHHAQRTPDERPVETTPGVCVWRVWRPIERVGVYVPGGMARYPSCLLMAAIPARVAGCREVVICTPAGRDGRVPAETLAAAALAGVDEVYAIGGAQAIAALAYGTESIRAVDKIYGAGGAYVAEAKALVSAEVAIDLPAGPSEILIVADETARPDWLAADLLAQAEHGPESACVLVTPDAPLATATLAALRDQLATLPTRDVIRASLERNGALLIAPDMDAALAFANEYAAEHLELVMDEAEAALDRITHAGSVFLGAWAPVAAGDYATGGNHTLPTGAAARAYGPLSVESFGRQMQAQRLVPDGLGRIATTVRTLATAEGLPAHAASIAIRSERGNVSADASDASATGVGQGGVA